MVTIKDVAKAAEVSVATVSIVMNDKSRERSIRESTQERVKRIIQENLELQCGISLKGATFEEIYKLRVVRIGKVR